MKSRSRRPKRKLKKVRRKALLSETSTMRWIMQAKKVRMRIKMILQSIKSSVNLRKTALLWMGKNITTSINLMIMSTIRKKEPTTISRK
jgi:hypothetical protein